MKIIYAILYRLSLLSILSLIFLTISNFLMYSSIFVVCGLFALILIIISSNELLNATSFLSNPANLASNLEQILHISLIFLSNANK